MKKDSKKDDLKKENETKKCEKKDCECKECNTQNEKIDEAKNNVSEVDKLKDEVTALNDKNLRLMAEFDNFKKRTSKEKDEMYEYAKINCISEFLAVADNFTRAVSAETADENYKKGMTMIMNQFFQTLEKLGVEEIQSMNMTFDPNLHHAIKQIEDDNFESNTVCEVFQKGYKIGDKIIRPAMVVVANP